MNSEFGDHQVAIQRKDNWDKAIPGAKNEEHRKGEDAVDVIGAGGGQGHQVEHRDHGGEHVGKTVQDDQTVDSGLLLSSDDNHCSRIDDQGDDKDEQARPYVDLVSDLVDNIGAYWLNCQQWVGKMHNWFAHFLFLFKTPN